MAGHLAIPGVELLEELGHGTYSVVYRARRGSEVYAVKVPLRNETGTKLRILGRRFRREAVALARLRHPLLPKIMEVGVVDRSPYIIMELAMGVTLAETLAHGPMEEPDVVELGRQLASALGEVHRSGLVHRDVKPKNIVFDGNSGQIRLVDFGFAASIDAAFRILEPVGTLEYAAPEQVSDLRQRVDGRADLYAVGCVLYECLARLPPFTELDPKRLFHQHFGVEPPDVREVAPKVSAAMASIIRRLLARSPDDRYPDAASLLHDLNHIEETRAGATVPSTLIESDLPVAVLPLLGRDYELDKLRNAWISAQLKGSRVVMLRGASGTGKTRLARAFIDEVIVAGSETVLAACHAWDPRPFSAIREIVEGYAKINSEVPAAERESIDERLRALADDLAAPLKVLSPALGAIFADAGPVPNSSDAQHIFVEGLAEFLAKLFREVSPAVVFVDDVQWLDSSSRRVLRRAMDRVTDANMLYVLAIRGEAGTPSEVDRFLEGLPCQEISLGRLQDSDTTSLVQAYLGEAHLDPELIRSVSQLSDGSPLSTLEILRMMLDEGLLLPSWGAWKFDAQVIAQMQLPHNTVGILERRVASLDDMTRTTLSAAAILGMTFSDRLLPLVCNLEEGHTIAALAEARRSMLVQPNRQGTHRFVHDSIREVLMKRLTDEEQRTCHQLAAEAMDRIGGSAHGAADRTKDPTAPRMTNGTGRQSGHAPEVPGLPTTPDADFYYRLASHYARGVPGRTALRAYESNIVAGKLAFYSFDNERALAFFSSAADAARLLPDIADPELSFIIAEAKLRIGALDESLLEFQRVLRASTDLVQQASALSRMAWIYEMQLDTAKAWVALEEAFAKLGGTPTNDSPWRTLGSALRWVWQRLWPGTVVASGPERDRIEALCVLWYQTGRLATVDVKPMRVLQAAFSGLGSAVRLGPSKPLATMYLTMSFVFIALGRQTAGQKYVSLAEGVARSTGDPVAVAHSLQVHSAVATWIGDLHDAVEVGTRCMDEYGHWRELSEYCLLAYSLQFIESMKGRSSVSWGWMERVIEKVNQHEGHPILLELLELGARAALTSLGREAEADAMLVRLHALTVPAPPNSGFYVTTFPPRLRLFTERGDLGPEFEALVAKFQALKLNPRRVHVAVAEYYIHLAHARVHAVLRAPKDERRSKLEKLETALRDLKAAARIAITRAHAIVVEGYLDLLRGNSSRASDLFAKAEVLGQLESAPWILYAVHRGRAHLLRAAGSEELAREQAMFAEALAEQHCMAYRLSWIREEFGLSSVGPIDIRTTDSFDASSDAVEVDSGTGHLDSLRRLVGMTAEELEPQRRIRDILDGIIGIVRCERADLFIAEDRPRRETTTTLQLKHAAGRSAAGHDLSAPSPVCRLSLDRLSREWTSSHVEGSTYAIAMAEDCTMAAAPFAEGDRLMGAIYVERNAGPFSQSDGALLAELSDRVPLVLEFARALRLRQRAEEEPFEQQKVGTTGRLPNRVGDQSRRMFGDKRAPTVALVSSVANGSTDRLQVNGEAAMLVEPRQRPISFSSGRIARAEQLAVGDRLRRCHSLLKEVVGPSISLSVRPNAETFAVTADPARIDQMLVTLAVRARDVMSSGGTLVIDAANAILEDADVENHPVAKSGQYVRISVSDTGQALDAGALKRIFETVASDDRGTRLPLGRLYQDVVRNGGFVDVESIAGEGTTFRIYWPRSREDAAVTRAAARKTQSESN